MRLHALIFGLVLLIAVGAHADMINEWSPIETTVKGEKMPEAFMRGENWVEPITGMEFVWVPGGCFKMGSPPRVEGRDGDEGPVHEVCVPGIWIGLREVTQGQWRRIMLNNPARFRKGDYYPVERVAWDEVVTFIEKLSERNSKRYFFRLPTEAEWEYACRGRGTRMRYSGGTDPGSGGWYASNSSGSSQETGSKPLNPAGLFDLSGNVWEWVWDSYQPKAYEKHERDDPKVEVFTSFRVIRGGGWKSPGSGVRCANRGFENFEEKGDDIGFRLVRTEKEMKRTVPELTDFQF